MSLDAPQPPLPEAPPPPRRWPVGVVAALYLALAGLTLLAWHVGAAPALLTLCAVALPWLWVAMVVGALLPALDRRRSRLLLPVSLLVVATWAAVWGRAWAGWPGSGSGVPLRLLSWNVQRLGFQDADDSAALACVARAVEQMDPDAVVLLEVSARDVERLSVRLALECVAVDYQGTGRPDRGGLAACARGGRWSLGRTGPRRYVASLSWYYVFAELVRGDAVFNLLAVHLQPYALSVERVGQLSADRVARAQSAETDALLARVGRLRDPTVVAGDFNSPRDAAVHHEMRRFLTDAWEQAAWGPGATVHAGGFFPLRVDYAYVSNQFTVTGATQPDPACSDHRPVLADLVLAPGAQPKEPPSPR